MFAAQSPCAIWRKQTLRVQSIARRSAAPFYRDEQRLEIAFAKAVVALALDEFEKDRPDRIRRENLQQHLCVAAIDHALAVDQNAVALQPSDVLAVPGQPRVDLFEIGVRR